MQLMLFTMVLLLLRNILKTVTPRILAIKAPTNMLRVCMNTSLKTALTVSMLTIPVVLWITVQFTAMLWLTPIFMRQWLRQDHISAVITILSISITVNLIFMNSLLLMSLSVSSKLLKVFTPVHLRMQVLSMLLRLRSSLRSIT